MFWLRKQYACLKEIISYRTKICHTHLLNKLLHVWVIYQLEFAKMRKVYQAHNSIVRPYLQTCVLFYPNEDAILKCYVSFVILIFTKWALFSTRRLVKPTYAPRSSCLRNNFNDLRSLICKTRKEFVSSPLHECKV